MVQDIHSGTPPVTGRLVWHQHVGVVWKIYFGIFFAVMVVCTVLMWHASQSFIQEETWVVGVVLLIEAVLVYAAYLMGLEIMRRPVSVYEQGIDVTNAPRVRFKLFAFAGVRGHFRLRSNFFRWEEIVYLDKMKISRGPYGISSGVVYVIKTTRAKNFSLRFSDDDEREFHNALKDLNAVKNIFTVQPPKFLKTDMAGIEYRINVKRQ